MEINLTTTNDMLKSGRSNRGIYKSIVIGMSICLPAGIGAGIAYDHITLGILAGNTAGILLGTGIGIFNRNKNR
jgi:hypothetical protein